MSRVLVLGSGGMLGHKVLQRLGSNHTVVGTLRGAPGDPPYGGIPLFRDATIVGGVDARDWSTVAGAIDVSAPEVVVNCIGMIKHREVDAEASWAINADFPRRLAVHCGEHGIRMVHISTDCVFDGTRGGYTEDDAPNALDLYGRSKALGEVDRLDHVLTLRTSLVGRELSEFKSLLEWFLAQQGEVRGFRKAFFSGVTTLWIADLIGRLIAEHGALHGLYQAAGPRIAKYELLRLFAKAYRRDLTIIPDDEFELDRSLIGDRFTAATGIQAPSWEMMVAAMADDPTPYEEWR